MAEPSSESIALPAVDFSKPAVEKAVLRRVGQSYLVTLPAALGAGGLVVALTAGLPVFLYPALGVLALGAGTFVLNYFGRYDANASSYLEAVRESQRRFFADEPIRLRKALQAANCQRGLHQLDELEQSFNNFQILLQGKFSKNGMTLGRFLGTAEQVRAAALQKLQLVLDHMKAMESIPANLDHELKAYAPDSDTAHHIQERIDQRKQALVEIDKLHADIEASLTRISDISLRIAHVGMDEVEEGKFEAYLDELRGIAAQAQNFRKET